MANEAVPVVAVVGRPNVGKSTLVNRILGSRQAVVEDTGTEITRINDHQPEAWTQLLPARRASWRGLHDPMSARR